MAHVKEKLNTILLALLGSEDLVERWWTSPNKAFNNQSPNSMLDTDPKVVKAYLLGQINGDYS